ncbi:FAD/NAD(P)-binding domain-containing protein [Laetiporus sulphureus 93-53]|uniref:FAD/NAD(P)-binding domain-containing protein n=1 Tax=Laetiporus sulphureus 93-53 TaxID=1314785 RepID=A0A165HN90_9APHY|nr:FAD/NAD(P)-binding domain-containing protein [Laetiporus sulphureus 93-53]KZT11959.1 FAD/NAD(P)-binding domain-containing protein [Laetiporus sulphureus 93-53]
MKIAVVGSGVSGLAATWLLNEYSNHEVHLYEAESRPGGHANTISFVQEGKAPIDVDTGFIVFNPITYPNFLRFLNLYPHLRERILRTTMSFSVSRNAGAFEWAGTSLDSVFCQRHRLLDPSMWRMLYDILHFNACAPRALCKSKLENLSIGEYLKTEGYSDSFRDNYLIPMTAAIWSTPPDKCFLDFPAQTLVQFMHNHHLLQIIGRPSWLTLHGGSRTYVDQILSALPAEQLHLSTPVIAVNRRASDLPTHIDDPACVELLTAQGERINYDHVILACHSDTALSILKAGDSASAVEEHVLGAFEWSKNIAVLHSDERLMPQNRKAWSCWNYLTSSTGTPNGTRKVNGDQVSLTYWMNELQHILEDTHGLIFVTLNPPFEPDLKLVKGRFQYEHPILGSKAIGSQNDMSAIRDHQGVSFAGAWLKYGFHEDGFTSGLRAASALINEQSIQEGQKCMPFEIVDADRRPNLVEMRLLPLIFDAFEGMGLRMILGAFLGGCLAILRMCLARTGRGLVCES